MVAIVVGVLVATSGGDDDDVATDTVAPVASEAPVDTSAAETTTADTAATDTAATGTEPTSTEAAAGGGEVTFPLSFTQAEEQGIDVAWGEQL